MENRDYREQAAVVADALATMLEDNPDAFDVLVFRPVSGSEEVSVEGQEDVVGTMESSERRVSYADPVPARALLVPDDALILEAYTDGSVDDPLSQAQPQVLILSIPDVPRQSIVRWKEFMSPNDEIMRDVNMYVLDIKASGRAPVASIRYFVIPLMSGGVV